MRVFVSLGLYGLMMMFVGCATHHHDMGAGNKTLLMCRAACYETQINCSAACHNNDVDCEIQAHESTKRFFCKYKHEQHVKGGIVARELKSYRDPLQCRKITCDCFADYRVCAASCAGTIHKRLQAPRVY